MKARDFYDRLQQETCLFGGNCSLFERFVHYDTGVEFNLLKWCAAVLCRYDITCQTTYEVWHRPALSWKMIGWLYCDTSQNDTVLRDKMHWKQCDAYNQTIDNECLYSPASQTSTRLDVVIIHQHFIGVLYVSFVKARYCLLTPCYERISFGERDV